MGGLLYQVHKNCFEIISGYVDFADVHPAQDELAVDRRDRLAGGRWQDNLSAADARRRMAGRNDLQGLRDVIDAQGHRRNLLLLLLELIQLALKHHSAPADDPQVRHQFFDFSQQMARDDDGDSPLPIERFQNFPDFNDPVGIKSVGRFIQENGGR